MPKEYERRFKIDRLPEDEPVSDLLIRQVYWRLGNGWVLRLRRIGTDSHSDDLIAVKGPRHGSERWEFEYRLTSPKMTAAERQDALGAVLNLYHAGSEHSVVKRRRSYILGGTAWDVDEFLWENQGLIIAELEMEDQSALLAVQLPEWVGREVTLDPRFNNENLAYEPFSLWQSEFGV